MCIGDSLGDRESKPDSAGRARVLPGELLERLEQSRQLAPRNRRTGVRDREQRFRSGSSCRNLDPAGDGVVPNCVPEKVVDEALDQSRVADRRSPFKLRSHRQLSGISGSEKSGDDRSEVDRLAPSKPILTVGESKTRVEQSLLFLAGVENLCSDLSPSGCVGNGIGHRKFDERSLCCQGRAELVRDVGGKACALG